MKLKPQNYAIAALVLVASMGLLAQDATDYSIWVLGPRSTVAGHNAFLTVGSTHRAGDVISVKPTVKVEPHLDAQIHLNITSYPAESHSRYIKTNSDVIGVRLLIPEDTPNQSYRVTITYSGAVTKSTTFDFEVVGLPLPLEKQAFPRPKDLPAIQRWKDNAVAFGSKHISRNHIACCGAWSEVWYYDGARAFLQIYDLTGEQKYLDFAKKINIAYRDYIIATGGRGFARYPHGFEMFLNRGFEPDLQRAAIESLRDHTQYAYRPQWAAPWSSSREIAFAVSSNLTALRIGLEPHPKYMEQIEIMMGQFEQWFVSESAEFVYPFQVGLGAEAMIEYHELTGDPRVPYLLKLAADKMYPNPLTWNESTQSMMIVEKKNGKITRGAAPDLNLMIAPLYGWIFQQTGDVRYRNIGDRLFTSGVNQAYLDGGKQFTQSYRWSFRYIEWRNSYPNAAMKTVRRR